MKRITIFYDNWCPNCTKFSRIIRKIDWFHKINIRELRNIKHTRKYSSLNMDLAIKEMACYNGIWNYGYNSIFLIFKRLPLFWIFIPLLFLFKITGIGQLMYKELALKRKIIPIHCDQNCRL